MLSDYLFKLNFTSLTLIVIQMWIIPFDSSWNALQICFWAQDDRRKRLTANSGKSSGLRAIFRVSRHFAAERSTGSNWTQKTFDRSRYHQSIDVPQSNLNRNANEQNGENHQIVFVTDSNKWNIGQLVVIFLQYFVSSSPLVCIDHRWLAGTLADD
jgi:hypothetical protein